VARRAVRKRRLSSQIGVLVSRYDDPDAEPFYDPDFEPEEPEIIFEQQRDSFVDEAKAELIQFFSQEPESVFYQRQLQVIFEDKYFHWITVRALSELVQEGKIATEALPLLPGSETTSGFIMFYRSNAHRYWKRDADEIVKLVYRFSDSAFTSALGAQGETMFDAALPTGGFMPLGRKVRSHRGMEWTETKHDLDRAFERDGIAYGIEIKNTLGYIEKSELEVKVKMCKFLGLRPLFIFRFAPKSYINLVREEGGFTLIFK
jgi:hypothetical protein